jgi:Helicase conserved C-terminal domain
MSDVLRVAEQLRALSDNDIARLVKRCQINASPAKDFFDLAASFLQTKAQDAWLNSANRDTLQELLLSLQDDGLAQKAPATDPNFELALTRIKTDAKLAQLISERCALAEHPFATKVTKTTSAQDLADSGIRAFLTVLAISEFGYELEHRYLREIGKQGLALPEVKLFSAHLGIDGDQVKQLWEIARLAGVVTSVDSRWVLGPNAASWFGSSIEDRWQSLSDTWLALLGADANGDLKAHFADLDSVSLTDSLAWIYPLSDTLGASKQLRLTDFAEAIGLTSHGMPQPWFADAISGKAKAAKQQISGYFPATSNRIIVQADLSVIAPGPLSLEIEKKLRTFLDADKVGLASHFRISALSLSYALETGLDVDQIRTTLVELSGKNLPQPVEYLLADVARRFGRLRVVADDTGASSFIEVHEPAFAIELANDLRLRSLSLRQIEPLRLFTKFSADVAYYTLRENGHLAVRVTAKGKIVSPEKIALGAQPVSPVNAFEVTLAKLRAADSSAGSSDDETKLRQVQLAIKNKANIRVVYVGRDGGEYEFVLEPIGLANGRLRGRDRKADIERTLPLANITTLELT